MKGGHGQSSTSTTGLLTSLGGVSRKMENLQLRANVIRDRQSSSVLLVRQGKYPKKRGKQLGQVCRGGERVEGGRCLPISGVAMVRAAVCNKHRKGDAPRLKGAQ